MSTPEVKDRNSRFFFEAAGVILLLGLVAYLHLSVFVLDDPNPEAICTPVSVAYMDKARSEGVPLREYFASSRFDDFRNEFFYACKMPGQLMMWHYFAHMEPLANTAYLPFVRLFGLTPFTINAYSFFWMLASLLVLYLYMRAAYGGMAAFLSVLLVNMSLVWLIHVKVAYEMWMISVFMVQLAAAGALFYRLRNKAGWLVLSGAASGFLLAEGWIGVAFAVLLVAVTVLTSIKTRKWKVVSDAALFGGVMLSVNLVFVWLYCLYFNAEVADVYQAWSYAVFGRLSEGSTPHFKPGLFGKVIYGLKCLFYDSATVDHPDKYLRGEPFAPWLLSVLFAAGTFTLLRRRSREDVAVLVWLGSIMLPMFLVYMYAHRYMLIGLPAMAAVAAVGAQGIAGMLGKLKSRAMLYVYWSVLTVMLTVQAGRVQKKFTIDYLSKKPPEFEHDRFRGHWSMSRWIRERCLDDTLVVLSDPVFVIYHSYLFNNFDKNYRYIFWSNHLNNMGTEQLFKWIQEVLDEYSSLVFVMSSSPLGPGPDGRAVNDWSSLRALFPDKKSDLIYSYDSRPPYLFLFRFSKDDIRGQGARLP